MKIAKYILTFLALTLTMVGCVLDDADSYVCADLTTTIPLVIGDPNEIDTYSEATPSERYIAKVYLFVFDGSASTSTLRAYESVVYSNITGNPSKTPKIKTNLKINNGDRILVTANANLVGTPVVGTTKVDDINNLMSYAVRAFLYSDNIPMCGTMVWDGNSTTECEMVRALAKIEVVYDIAPADDVTNGVFEQLEDKGLLNHVYHLDSSSRILRVGGDIYNSTGEPHFYNPATLLCAKLFYNGISSSGTTFHFIDERPNATQYFKDGAIHTVSNTEWAEGRLAILIRGTMEQAMNYRLDFYDRTTGKYLDIKRNCHYKITVKKVKSFGYPTALEAYANPGSNLEYDITVDEQDDSATSNGQYGVKTDKKEAIVTDEVSTADNLVRFTCVNQFDRTKISTRTVRLVGADKTTTVSTSAMQLCDKNGNALTGNTMTFTSADDNGYQLKFTTPAAASLPTTQTYVEICYGNVRHYVPVTPYILTVVGPDEYTYEGGKKYFKTTSYKIAATKTNVKWTAKEYSLDGGETWSTTRPSWITTIGESGSTGNYGSILAKTPVNNHTDALRATTPVVGTYNLANQTNGGATVENTANCYIVSAPGRYSLPLVYGNAIKGGAPNSSAYHSTLTIDPSRTLSDFIKHDGTIITDPYIADADNAILVWQDAKGLVSVDATLSGTYPNQTLTFSVPAANICQGNAVVAVRNAANVILWSWHIWVIDYVAADDLTYNNHDGNEFTFMPFNLGWCDATIYPAHSVKVRVTQSESGFTKTFDINQFGHIDLANHTYYQWVRKDPLVGKIDSVYPHESKVWYDETNTAHSTMGEPLITIPFDGNNDITAANLFSSAIQNPGTRCWVEHADGWVSKYNLWDAGYSDAYVIDFPYVKSIYDPSPVGYHVTPRRAFTGFSNDGTGTNWNQPHLIRGTFVTINGLNGWNMHMKNGELFIPLTGYKPGGNVFLDFGTLSYNWESSARNIWADCLRLHSTQLLFIGEIRGYARAVLCVRE